MDGLSEGSHKVIIKHPWNCSEFTPTFIQGPPTAPMHLVPVPFRSPSRSSGPRGYWCLDVSIFTGVKRINLTKCCRVWVVFSWEEFLNLKCTLQISSLYVVDWGLPCLNAFPEFKLVTFHINAPPSVLQAPSPPTWFSVNAKCWFGAWRSQHLRQNRVGLFGVPKSTISETCWGVTLWWYLDTHDLEVHSSTWRLNLEDVLNQHENGALTINTLNVWLMVNMMALSRVLGGSMPQIQLAFLEAMSWDTSNFSLSPLIWQVCIGKFPVIHVQFQCSRVTIVFLLNDSTALFRPPQHYIHLNRPGKNLPSHPLRKRPLLSGDHYTITPTIEECYPTLRKRLYHGRHLSIERLLLSSLVKMLSFQ